MEIPWYSVCDGISIPGDIGPRVIHSLLDAVFEDDPTQVIWVFIFFFIDMGRRDYYGML